MSNYSSSIAPASAGTMQLFTAAFLATFANNAVADYADLPMPDVTASYSSSAVTPSSLSNELLSTDNSQVGKESMTEASIMAYKKMLQNQQPLESEFAKVLEDNFWDLCGV